MLTSYAGALKAWMYWPILHALGPRLSTLREPMLLVGAASIWLFFLLLRRVAGDRAAIIGSSLLATDSIYLVTTCFDWGPVALQHVLIIGGMLLVIKFHQERPQAALAGAFFLFGLALWDKALAVWMLSGLGVSAALLYSGEIRRALRAQRVAAAGLAFCIGALPLLVYNIGNSFRTFNENVHRDTANLAAKAHMLEETIGGPGLFGWLTAEDSQTPAPHQPRGPVQRASAAISKLAGHPRRSLALYGFLLALALAPLAAPQERRAIMFACIAMAVAWIQMATTANAGGSVHHTILLWPLPEMVIAISFAAASRRFGRAGRVIITAIVPIMLVSGGLVMNEYYTVMLRNGGAMAWNDGILELSDYLRYIPAKQVLSLDWGITDPLRFLNGGHLALAGADEQLSKPELSVSDKAIIERMISEPSHVFIAHTSNHEFFPGSTPKLLQLAADSGYHRQKLTVISDRYGRPVFELFRFARLAVNSPAGN
ncbi:conserved membrane hypothetical protein [Candidatus Sulfopaludibacter sp. SbA3]|nr:conserved membrane hypothetical protein [Candidatus Sulfopaludibacter sp. SbA3]